MAEDKADDHESGIDDFLIVEYQHFADSFWRNEELGEKRLNYFMSLLTAAIAGLALLATSDKGFTDSQLQWLTFSVGLALLLFGLSTLLRMLRRNEAADEYKHNMDLVRKRFTSHYGLMDYKPFEEPPPRRPRKLFTGGLAQTSALLNSLIAASVTATGLLFAMSAEWVAGLAALVFVVSLTAQFAYIRWRHRR